MSFSVPVALEHAVNANNFGFLESFLSKSALLKVQVSESISTKSTSHFLSRAMSCQGDIFAS